MATKVIDVAVATIRNYGSEHVSPKGFILGRIVRAVDDEQIFQTEILFDGGVGLQPGQSVTVGVYKRLTVHHFGLQEIQGLNQMLVFHADLKQRHVVLGTGKDLPYFGTYNFKVRFDEITGFHTFPVRYNTTEDHKIEIVYTVNLVASNRPTPEKRSWLM
ncbi:hypothetical protein [Bacillus sp. BR_16]|uniref:hypothetical protein n=1 Tax=Bacillus TaxID=1386 RepID=UPI0035C1F3A7